MASSVINNYYINVSDKGSLDKVSKAVKGLNQGLDHTTDKANKANRSIANGAAAADSSARSFSKLSKAVDGSIVQVYAGFAANVFALSVAFEQLRKASQVQQVVAGIEYLGTRSGLALGATAKALREVTGAAISTEQALRATAQLAAAGFDAETITRVGKAAADTSVALGRNMTDSIDRLSKGITKLEPELLDELGIMTKLTEATSVYALANNKSALSLSSVEKRIAFSNAVLAEAEAKFGGVASAAGNTLGYEKLASALEDLKIKGLNLANVVLTPLSNILAGSSTSLIGASTLFAATLTKQVLPGLYNTAAAAKTTAEEFAKLQAAELGDIKAITGRTRAATIFNNSLKEDLTHISNTTNALNNLNHAVEDYDKKLDKIPSSNTKARASIITQIEALNRQRGELEQLQTATSNSSLATAKANTLQAASTLDVSKTFRGLKATYEAAHVQQSLLAAGFDDLSKKEKIAFASIRAGAITAATGIKTLGAATLAAVPYIGAIVLAAGLLKQAFDFATYSKAAEEYKKAIVGLKDAVDNLSKSSAQYEKIASSVASLQTRVAKEYEIAGNSILQVASAAQEVIDKNKELQKNPWPDWMTGNSNKIQKDRFVSAEDLKNIDQLNNQLKGLIDSQKLFQSGPVGLKLFDSQKGKELKAEIKAINDLLNSSNPLISQAAKQSIQSAGGFGALSAQMKSANGASTALAKVLAGLTDNGIADLNEAVQEAVSQLKNLETASTKFLTGTVTTTPFDDTLKSLTAVNNAVIKAQQAAAKSGSSADLGGILSGLGPDTTRLLDVASQKAVEIYTTADKTKQTLLAQKEAQGFLNAEQQKQLATAEASMTANRGLLDNISNQLLAKEGEFKLNQDLARQTAAMVSLEQARLGKLSAAYALSGAGTAARMKQENAIRGLQASQLQAQRAIIVATIATQKENLEILKTQKDINRELSLQEVSLKAQAAHAAVIAAQAKGDKGAIDAAKQAAEAADKELQVKIDIRNTENAIRDQDAAQKTLLTQIGAIMAANNSQAEISSQKSFDQLTITNSIASSLEDVADKQKGINVLQAQLADISAGIDESFNARLANAQQSLKQGENTAKQAKRTLSIAEAQYKIDLAALANLPKSSAAYKEGAANASARLGAAKETYDVTVQTVDAQANLTQETLLGYNYIAKYIPAKQQILDLANKELDAQKSLIDGRSDLIRLEAQVKAAKQGRELTAGEERELNIRSLKDQLEFAKTSASIKMAVIAAEYALLKAQAYQQGIDLRAQRQKMIDAGRPQAEISNVTDIIDNIDKLPGILDRAQQAQAALIDQQTSSLKEQIKLAETQARVKNPVYNPFASIATRTAAVEAGQKDAKVNGDTKSVGNTLPNRNPAANDNGDVTEVIVTGVGKAAGDSLKTFTDQAEQYGGALRDSLAGYVEEFNKLGPNGEAVGTAVAGMVTIAEAIGQVSSGLEGLKGGFEGFDESGKLSAKTAESLGSVFQGIGAGISAISSIQQSMSAATTAAIDQEIAAEQARDGKSAESVAKIAGLEAKKDAAARKSFETNKKLQMAQAVINTASAVTMALASAPFPFSLVLAGLAGAMGAAQLAVINSTSYQSASSSAGSSASTGVASLAIGQRGNSVDLAKGNTNTSGEQAYLRGESGYGSGSSDFTPTPRAYGGSAYLVGEKGPEIVNPIEPSVISSGASGSKVAMGAPINANFTIHALDASGVKQVLQDNVGTLIETIRNAANDSGSNFLPGVDTKPMNSKARRA